MAGKAAFEPSFLQLLGTAGLMSCRCCSSVHQRPYWQLLQQTYLHGFCFKGIHKRSCACVLLQDVEAARHEANENVKFLKPLRKYLEKLNTMDDFVALTDQFKPMLHTLLLIWKHSKSYNSSARFATLLREICNDLIMQVGHLCPVYGTVCYSTN